MRTTKIVATLGPATSSEEGIRNLIKAGVNVIRLNASHGTQEIHAECIHRVRKVAAEMGTHTGILLDLQGPKIRLGKFEGGKTDLATGTRFTITTETMMGTSEKASTTYTDFAKDVKTGDRVLLADGSIELRVIDSNGIEAVTEVVSGGPIGDNKGINLPGVQVSTSSLTKKDIKDLRFGLEQGIDFVALSFVRKREDVIRLKLILEETEVKIPIVAKIEKPEGWNNLDQILEEADGVMVARGDLGVEVAMEKVPAIQKSIIRRARQKGKFVITATQMLESMIEHPYPTRAEVSDVANAIYDGTDAVMLSAETSTGAYPFEAVKMMARIAAETEASLRQRGFKEPPTSSSPSHPEIIADAAYRMARMVNAAAIVVFSVSGSSARMIARYRPPVPVFTFTHTAESARQMAVIYAIDPLVVDRVGTVDEMLIQMDHLLQSQGKLKPKDSVVFVAGQPVGRQGTTNLIKLHRVGEVR